MDDKTKAFSKAFIASLPPELIDILNISLMMNQEAFSEYTETMNTSILDDASIMDDVYESIFITLTLALMHKNAEMTTFIFQIIQKSGYNTTEEHFKKEIEDINKVINSAKYLSMDKQFGGANFADYLYGIGAIISAIVYNYYIITNGSWDILSKSIDEISELSEKIKKGCDINYVPSKTVSFLAGVTIDPTLLYTLEYAKQCVSSPELLSKNLIKLEEKKISTAQLSELSTKIKALPKYPALPQSSHKLGSQLVPFEENLDEDNLGSQLVPFGENLEEITDFLNARLLVLKKDDHNYNVDNYNVDLTMLRLKDLADMTPEKFKQEFTLHMSPTTFPTQAPTIERAINFGSDLIGAFKELAPATFTPSFSFQNVFLWALQDTIRATVRKIEYERMEVKNEIQDLITKASRIFTEISSLPYIMSFLLYLNYKAMTAIIFFVQKIIDSNSKLKDSSKKVKELEDKKPVEQVEIIEGGYIRHKNRKTHKRKTRKYKRSGKRRQTKRKKNRRVTRKR